LSLHLRLKAWGDTRHPNLRGALWSLAGGFFLTLMFAAIKHVLADLPPFIVGLFRTFFAFLLMLPWLMRVGLPGIRTDRPLDHFLRVITGIGSFVCLVFALETLILSDSIVLSFSYPLWSIVIAALFMGERVRIRRTVATIIGFVGVILVVQPQGGLAPGAVLALCSAVLTTLALFNVKRLTATEPPQRIVFYFFFIGTLLLLPPAIWTWQTPTLEQFAWLAGSGLCGAIGQSCLTRAYRAGDMTVVQPMDFMRIPMAAGMGFVLFAEVPGGMAALGTAIVMAASAYIVYRASRLRAATAPPRPDLAVE
jgi:drug/metabolite transporter (DMT)-like permease